MNVLLAGKTVVVSGAAGGVGRSVVSKLLAEGARVCAVDIAESVLDLEERSDAVVSVRADVTRRDQVDAVFDRAEASFGPVDVLVSNAGFIVSKSVHETSDEEWDQVMDANAKSLFLMSRRALPSMIERRAGAIVATGSISSVVGLPKQAAYCAAKGALLQLVRQMAIDYAGSNIRVNAVGAGSIDTPFLRRYLAGMADPSAEETAIKNAHPLGRWSQPDEIANAIIFLAGESASFVTGQILMADGGYTAR